MFYYYFFVSFSNSFKIDSPSISMFGRILSNHFGIYQAALPSKIMTAGTIIIRTIKASKIPPIGFNFVDSYFFSWYIYFEFKINDFKTNSAILPFYI